MLESLKFFINGFFTGKSTPLGLVAAVVSDKGFVRSDNQDSFANISSDGLLCVADGMGGGQGGGLASKWTCAEISNAWKSSGGKSLHYREHVLIDALQLANTKIRNYARDFNLFMMGTTFAGLLFEPGRSFSAKVIHVGDSRIYRYRYGRLDKLTSDHVIADTHILTRAVGTEIRANPEIKSINIQRGDKFLLCSDGVHDMVTAQEIALILKESSTPRIAAERLERAVRAAGAEDNYTIICAYAARATSNPRRRTTANFQKKISCTKKDFVG